MVTSSKELDVIRCPGLTIGLALPWGSHPYWLVLSVAVVLRGNLGDTLARRNARVLGTMLGCLVVVGLIKALQAAIVYQREKTAEARRRQLEEDYEPA